MIRNVIAAALVAAAPPLAAGADTCPTKADLDTGVRLTRADPLFSIVQTRTPDGLAEARVTNRGGTPMAADSFYSHPVTVSKRVGAGGTLTLDYANDTAGIDEIDQTFTWSSDVTLSSQGEVINSGVVTVSFLGMGDASVGDCTYLVWRLRDELTLDGSTPLLFEKSYAPDLGLILSSIRLAPDGSPVSSVFFDEITAE